MKSPFVSVIIPALNAEKTLARCLNAIKNLNFPKSRLEIILVDNGSKDGTLGIAKRFKARIFVKPSLSIGELRNFGARYARGSILAFIDSDIIVPKDWLKIGIPYLNERKVGMVGSLYTIPKNASWIAKTWELLRERKVVGEVSELDWLPAGNIINKSTFDELRGFSHIKTSEDVDLGLRAKEMGYKVVSDKRLKAIHLGEPRGIADFLKRRIWQSSTQIELFFSHKKKRLYMLIFSLYHLIFISFLIISFIMWAITRESKPLTLALIFFILPSLILALKNGIKIRRYKYIPSIAFMYLLWGIGNAISIIAYKQWRCLKR